MIELKDQERIDCLELREKMYAKNGVLTDEDRAEMRVFFHKILDGYNITYVQGEYALNMQSAILFTKEEIQAGFYRR